MHNNRHHPGPPPPPSQAVATGGVPILDRRPEPRRFTILIEGVTDGNQVDLSRFRMSGVSQMEVRQILGDLSKVVVPSQAIGHPLAGPGPDGAPATPPQP